MWCSPVIGAGLSWPGETEMAHPLPIEKSQQNRADSRSFSQCEVKLFPQQDLRRQPQFNEGYHAKTPDSRSRRGERRARREGKWHMMTLLCIPAQRKATDRHKTKRKKRSRGCAFLRHSERLPNSWTDRREVAHSHASIGFDERAENLLATWNQNAPRLLLSNDHHLKNKGCRR